MAELNNPRKSPWLTRAGELSGPRLVARVGVSSGDLNAKFTAVPWRRPQGCSRGHSAVTRPFLCQVAGASFVFIRSEPHVRDTSPGVDACRATHVVETSDVTQPDKLTDPELQALPAPRRPWRRATLASLGVTLLASSWLCASLVSDASYALMSGQPTEISKLSEFEPEPRHENAWVHGIGALDAPPLVYRRPLDPDRFRIAPVEGNPALWVELRQPEGTLGEHFVPPTSFVGRLVPLSDPGLRYAGLLDALAESGQQPPGRDAWLLIDGESPDSDTWVFGVMALLLAFAAFSAWGIYTLTVPARRRNMAHPAS